VITACLPNACFWVLDMKEPRGAFDDAGRRRFKSKCSLCGKTVWWCLAPKSGDMPMAFDGSGKPHIKTCIKRPEGQLTREKVTLFLLSCAKKVNP